MTRGTGALPSPTYRRGAGGEGSPRKGIRRAPLRGGCVLRQREKRRRRAARVLLLLACAPASAFAQDVAAPTPRAVIYPGDIIRDDMLSDSSSPVRDGGGPYALTRDAVVGKAARMTLLPGHAIPFAGITNRKLVANGKDVTLLFEDDGLTIVTTGSALQDGAAGDLVRVRNADSGVTVSGVVQPDGAVKVGG